MQPLCEKNFELIYLKQFGAVRILWIASTLAWKLQGKGIRAGKCGWKITVLNMIYERYLRNSNVYLRDKELNMLMEKGA